MSKPVDKPADHSASDSVSESAAESAAAQSNGAPDTNESPPLRSVHTSNLPQIFEQGGFSLLVTTYQAGKLVVLRNDKGVLNTHFRNLHKPMGLAIEGGKLAIGCNIDIWEFHNIPAVCQKLDESDENKDGSEDNSGKGPLFTHDACFMPRRSHTTGDVQIHESGLSIPHSVAWRRAATSIVLNPAGGLHS